MIYNGDAFRLAYMHSKRDAEDRVRGFCESGMNIVIACPSAVIASNCDVLHGWGKVMLDLQNRRLPFIPPGGIAVIKSEEHTSELQSLMRISYAVFCLKKKNKKQYKKPYHPHTDKRKTKHTTDAPI